MTITAVPITWGNSATEPVVNPDGSSPSGALTFTLTSAAGEPISIQDSGTGETVLPLPVVGQLVSGLLVALPVGGGPYTPLSLFANDDSTTLPVGTYYLVHESLSSGSKPDWQFTVHHTSTFQSVAAQRPNT